MSEQLIFYGVILTLFTVLPFRICDGDICSSNSIDKACSCVFPNGTGIDLSPLRNVPFYTTKVFRDFESSTGFELAEYYFHPCSDVQPTFTPATVGTCGRPLSVCRHVRDMSPLNTTVISYKVDKDICDYMGHNETAEFSADASFVRYRNGPSDSSNKTTINTTIYLVCVTTDDQLHVKSLAEPDNVELSFYSRSACLKQISSPGRSFGSTLCIIFFSFILFYLVLGICTKKFLMGATGIEVIPNLAFWSDLPHLVKDGWAFMLNGFKLPSRGTGPPAPPNPNSYDSI